MCVWVEVEACCALDSASPRSVEASCDKEARVSKSPTLMTRRGQDGNEAMRECRLLTERMENQQRVNDRVGLRTHPPRALTVQRDT